MIKVEIFTDRELDSDEVWQLNDILKYALEDYGFGAEVYASQERMRMNYSKLMDVTNDLFRDVRGNYDSLKFGESIPVYQEIARLYAEHLGLDETAIPKLRFLIETAVMNA